MFTTAGRFEMMDYNITQLRQDPAYILYYLHWTRLITTGIIPFLYLLVTNVLIWRTIRQHKPSVVTNSQDILAAGGGEKINIGQRQTLRTHRVSPASTSGFSKLTALLQKYLKYLKYLCRTSLLIAIVVIYMACNVPRLLLNLAEHLNKVRWKSR